MIIIRLILLLTVFEIISTDQQTEFDLKRISFRGVSFTTTRDVIAKTFGPGKKENPNYECGFFSNDDPAGPFYQLVYADFNYIGSDREKFFLENVQFDEKGSIKLKYGDHVLTGLTTESEFNAIFGQAASDGMVQHPLHTTNRLNSSGSDDGAIFSFRNGRLTRFQYWTPC